MNAEFFALAFLAGLNPKLLALDLLLIENRRPRAMFLCLLLGGMTVAATVGLLDVLVFHADAIKAQGKVSAGVDLAVGLLLLAAGALLATGRVHGRRKVPVPAGGGPPDKPDKKDGWAQRVLSEPRLGLAMLVGAVIGIPGATYLTALHNLVTGKSSTAIQVVAVVIFVIIDFLLIIIPFAFLELRPEATKALLKHSQDWLLSHALRLMATIALLLGAYLAISGLIRLS
ncbi:MAG TPA: GAP family protein [Streptosporangiaceae bacterium]|nr:GAP family protein [Streptosporangiaceae bacterium]